MSIWQAFSPVQNFKAIFIRPKENFAAIDGLRAMSMLLIIGFHTIYISQFFVSSERYFEIVAGLPDFLRFVWMGDLALDIFFVISGFLISGLLIKEHQQQGKLNYGRFYWRRYLRLSPVYLFSILVYALAGGSNSENLWANVFYVNNFLESDDAAMSWTWSLAVEEQFYLLFPLLMSLCVLAKPNALRNLYGLLVLSFVLRLMFLYQNQDLWNANLSQLMFDRELFKTYYNEVYINLYTRFGGFICGAIAAHYFFTLGKSLDRFLTNNRGVIYFLTILAFIVVVVAWFNNFRVEPNNLPESLHSWYTLSVRNVFSMALAWLIIISLKPTIALAHLLAVILSSRIWYPLAQLSYSMYLWHFMVISSAYLTLKNGYEFRQQDMNDLLYSEMLEIFLVSTCVTLVLAMISYLLIEKPFMNLRRR